MYLYRDTLFTGDSLFRDGEDKVRILSGLVSEAPDQNRESLKVLLPIDFARTADGHSGVTLDAKKKLEENQRMAALYREHVLKEAPAPPVVQIQGLGSKKKQDAPQVLHKPTL